MDGFLRMSQEIAAKTPITFVKAINLVIGSWIVGAIVMATGYDLYSPVKMPEYGAGKLPEMGAGVGKAIRNFKGAVSTDNNDKTDMLDEAN